MNFKPRNFHTSPLYLRLNILNLPNKIFLDKNFLLSLFDDWFKFASETHLCETPTSNKGLLKISALNTKSYNKNSVKTS